MMTPTPAKVGPSSRLTAESDAPVLAERPVTPIPRLKVATIFLITFTEGLASTIVIPFVPFMVIEEFGYATTSVGYYAGMITSALNLASLFAFLILSYFSDVYGRKPLLLIGLFGNVISVLLFGVSTHLWMAIVFRALNGLLNGNGAIIKTYIREITDDTNQARVYTIRSTGYSVGTVAGSMLGGLLAPAPSSLKDFALFKRFPFLLPCLVSAGINIITIIGTFFFLPETLPRIVRKQQRTQRTKSDQVYEKVVEEATVADQEMVDLEPSSSTEGSDENLDEEDEDDRPPEFKAYMLKFWDVLKGKEVLLTIIAYSFVSYGQLCFLEVFSVWAIRDPQHGGIKFGEKELGIVNGCGGVLMMISNLFLYHHLDRRFGTRNVFITASAIVAVWYAIAPFLNLFYPSGYVSLMVASAIFFGFAMQLGTTTFAAINLIINNVSGSGTVAAVNGVSASISSFTRLLAPVTGGSLFAATANAKLGFPLDYHFAFFFVAIMTAFQLAFVIVLPRSVLDKRKL